MNIFDHDALFEQIGFSSQPPSSVPMGRHQAAGDADEAGEVHYQAQPTFANTHASQVLPPMQVNPPV